MPSIRGLLGRRIGRSHRCKLKPLLLVAAVVAMARPAVASNTGFKLRYPLFWSSTTTNQNFLSLPYRYWPSKVVGAPQNSLDLCRDLNKGQSGAPDVGQVIRFDSPSDRFRVQPCKSSIKIFDLEPGVGYSVKPVHAGVIVELIGAHDDSFSPNKGGTPKVPLSFAHLGLTNNNWVSVPYHTSAKNSLDLCAMLNFYTAGEISIVLKYDPSTDRNRVQSCGSAIKIFDLVPGEAVSVKPKTTGISIGFDVW